MLRIRGEQLEAFRMAARNNLRERLAAHLHSSETGDAARIPRDLLLERVDAGLASARQFGLNEPNPLAAFLGLMFSIGPRFFEQRAIRQILGDGALGQADRMRLLGERATPGDWLEAARISPDWPAAPQPAGRGPA